MSRHRAIDLVLITPEAQVLEARVDSAVVPAHDGELQFLPNRAPIVCELGVGELRCRTGNDAQRFFVDGGFAQMLDGRLTVLTERAVGVRDITAEMVQAADAEIAAHPARGGESAQAANRRARDRARVLRALRK